MPKRESLKQFYDVQETDGVKIHIIEAIIDATTPTHAVR